MEEKLQNQEKKDSELDLQLFTPSNGVGLFSVREAPGCDKTRQLELTIAEMLKEKDDLTTKVRNLEQEVKT